MVCIKCGYENPELIPVFRERLKRRIVIGRITKIAAVVGLIVILHANFLFPWQWKTLNNKTAMILYAKEKYPGAKIIGHNYESAEFNPWRSPIDTIIIEWSDISFSIRAEDGKVIVDSYWHGVGKKLVYENCLKPFFDGRNVDFDYSIFAVGFERFVENDPNNDITQFDGAFTITIWPRLIKGKQHPRDLGWVYDFYRYWKDNVNFRNYEVRIIYPEETFLLEFSDGSDFTSENEFYSAVKTLNCGRGI